MHVLSTEFSQHFVFLQIRTVLDVGCCFGSLAAHFVSHNVITLTVDPYRIDGGNAQIALERGLPAVLGSLTSSQQLPVPSFAFDMVHCAIEFKSKGMYFMTIRAWHHAQLQFTLNDLVEDHRCRIPILCFWASERAKVSEVFITVVAPLLLVS